jgi:integrase
MPLTDKQVRSAQPQEKGYRLGDSHGLHLFVTPAGMRSWRLRFEHNGKERLVSLGSYPSMGLAEARRARDVARDQAMRPTPVATPDAPSFEAAARAWHDTNATRWKPHHAADVLASLEAEVFAAFGTVPVDRVKPAHVLAALRPMEARGAIETARRVKQRCARVFGFAIASGWCEADPTSPLKDALAPLPAKGHRPALATLDEARTLIQAIDVASGHPATKIALRFLALTAARPGEVAGMLWAEMHGDMWIIPSSRMKMRIEHAVPLAASALDCLTTIRPLTGRSRFVFPNAFNPGRPMSENAMSQMLVRLSYQGRHVPHGWRATFSTLMNEAYPADRAVIDLMLAHVPKDAVERAYNRATHVSRRRELAEAWAAMLLDGAADAEVLLLGPRRR